MKCFDLRISLLVLGLASGGFAHAQENWAGVPVPQSVPGPQPQPRLLSGNEWVEARCNQQLPEFQCPNGQSAIANLVPISEFARHASLVALGTSVEELRRDNQQGIAAGLAMGSAPMPSAPGRTTYSFNLSTFRGEQAIGGSVMHRLQTDSPVAVSVGISYAGQQNNGARIGIAGEF